MTRFPMKPWRDASRAHAARLACAVAVALSTCSAGALAAHEPPAVRASAPVDVAAAFYRWYVAKFRSDHDPLLELRAESQGRVSSALLDQLDMQMNESPTDLDYFLQSDDVIRPCHSVDAALLRATPDAAEVGVTLGSRKAAPWRVRVSLAREGGTWRIRQVARDARRPPAGAAARALSDC